MRVYLIRHGETDYNRDRIMQGHTEIPLNDTGIAQASRLGEKLREYPIRKFYSSDIRRAAMTACIVAAATGKPVTYEPLWRERNPGDLVHRPHEKALPFFFDRNYVPPRGEGWDMFENRVAEAFAKLAHDEAHRAGNHVGVITHGMVCRSFLQTHIGEEHGAPDAAGWKNTSLTVLDYDGKWNLVTLCDDSHLKDLVAG